MAKATKETKITLELTENEAIALYVILSSTNDTSKVSDPIHDALLDVIPECWDDILDLKYTGNGTFSLSSGWTK